jgi:hypothetical protein
MDTFLDLFDTLNRLDKRLHPPILNRGLFGFDVYRFCKKWGVK